MIILKIRFSHEFLSNRNDKEFQAIREMIILITKPAHCKAPTVTCHVGITDWKNK